MVATSKAISAVARIIRFIIISGEVVAIPYGGILAIAGILPPSMLRRGTLTL
jgi:hypothetical protein